MRFEAVKVAGRVAPSSGTSRRCREDAAVSAIVVLNPVSLAEPPLAASATWLDDLTGTTIGFLSNNKPNAGVLLARLAAELGRRSGVTARHYDKGVPSLEAPLDLRAEIRRECQGVVLAVDD